MGIPDMIAQIDAEIAALEMRIAKLRDARETIESLEGPVSQGGYHAFPNSFDTESKTTPSPRHNEIQTKVEARPHPQSGRRSSAGRAFVAGLIEKPASAKEQILTLIRETETPLTSGEIRDQIGSGVRKQTIWAALSDMTKNGVLNRSEDGKYTLASSE